MKAKDVQIGQVYRAKVSGKITKVRIINESAHGGWEGVNLETGRKIRIKTGRRLRKGD